MGYTHYWYRKPKVEQEKMDAIFADFSQLMPQFSQYLGAWDGKAGSKPDISTMGLSFNGTGEDSHESFCFPLIQDIPEWQKKDEWGHKGLGFVFCKTARKEYDIAVTSALLVIKKHLGDQIKISSDGTDGDWQPARDVCQEILGYGGDFIFDSEDNLVNPADFPKV